jgi:hypothetical protein
VLHPQSQKALPTSATASLRRAAGSLRDIGILSSPGR